MSLSTVRQLSPSFQRIWTNPRNADIIEIAIRHTYTLRNEGEFMEYRILIVEDDATIAAAVCRQIEAWGCTAQRIHNFREVMAEFASFSPHLVLMDIGLPFFDGYHWCSEIRKVSKTPVIFLSSASDNMNILMALNMGGDDFIVKPFDLNILTAKVQAMLRRTYDFSAGTDLMECQGAVLNLNDASLNWQGKRIELTKNEFRILQLLMENRGKVVPRDSIMDRLWETDSFVDDNTLTVNMTRLRRKLEDAGLKGFILTKKGLGYKVGE